MEADEKLKNKSAEQMDEDGVPGITSEERLIYELKCFKETGGRLDIVSWTLCAGSRYSDGDVPGVFWNNGRLVVNGFDSGSALPNLRARQVIV